MARPTAEIGQLAQPVAASSAASALALRPSASCMARETFMQSYLIAYIFWIGITVGSLGVLMISHLSGGAWGLVGAARLGSVDARTCRSWRSCSCRSP